MELGDKAVNSGDRKALEELYRIGNDSESPFSELASSLMFQVKHFYMFSSRTAAYKLVVPRLKGLCSSHSRARASLADTDPPSTHAHA
jgi:hypothetical protein